MDVRKLSTFFKSYPHNVDNLSTTRHSYPHYNVDNFYYIISYNKLLDVVFNTTSIYSQLIQNQHAAHNRYNAIIPSYHQN